jgi:hypothetical protein
MIETKNWPPFDNQAYNQQRKKRLGDSVHDYLSDDQTTPIQFYQDLKDEIYDMIRHYENELNKYKQVLQYISGDTKI